MGQKISIPIEVAERALSAVSLASGTGFDRPSAHVLNGVCVRVRGSTINFASTNGHWLAVYCLAIEGEDRPKWIEEQMVITLNCVRRMIAEMRWIIANVSQPTHGDIVIDADERKYTTVIGTMSLELNRESLREPFPSLSKLFPEDLPKKRSSSIMTIGSQYVKKIGEAFDVAADREPNLLRWEVTKDWMSPVIVTSPTVPELTVLVMGMRAEDYSYKNVFNVRPKNFILP